MVMHECNSRYLYTPVFPSLKLEGAAVCSSEGHGPPGPLVSFASGRARRAVFFFRKYRCHVLFRLSLGYLPTLACNHYTCNFTWKLPRALCKLLLDKLPGMTALFYLIWCLNSRGARHDPAKEKPDHQQAQVSESIFAYLPLFMCITKQSTTRNYYGRKVRTQIVLP